MHSSHSSSQSMTPMDTTDSSLVVQGIIRVMAVANSDDLDEFENQIFESKGSDAEAFRDSAILRECLNIQLDAYNKRTRENLPFIFLCIMQGKSKLFRFFLEKKFFDPNLSIDAELGVFLQFKTADWSIEKDYDSEIWGSINLLQIAALLHETEIVNDLLHVRASTEHLKIVGDSACDALATPFFLAELNNKKKHDSEELYISLVKGGDIPPTSRSLPYLYMAVRRKHYQLLQLLLNQNLLKENCQKHPQYEEEDILSHFNPAVHHSNHRSYYPLHFAAALGHYEMVKTLLEARAHPDCKVEIYPEGYGVNHVYELPLQAAVRANRLNIVNLLLEHKADITLIQEKKNRALDFAALFGHNEILQRLCEAKADPDIYDDQGCIPAHFAALGGNNEGLKILNRYSKNLLKLDNECRTIFDYAVLGGHLGLVEDLKKEFGAQPFHLQIDWTQFEKYADKIRYLLLTLLNTLNYNYPPKNAKENTVLDRKKIIDLFLAIFKHFHDPQQKGKDFSEMIAMFSKLIHEENLDQCAKLIDVLFFNFPPNNVFNDINTFFVNLAPTHFKILIEENSELADLFFSMMPPHLALSIFAFLQTGDLGNVELATLLHFDFETENLRHDYLDNQSFQSKSTFNDEYLLFITNATLNNMVLCKKNISYTEMKCIEPKGIIAFMQTCKNPAAQISKKKAGLNNNLVSYVFEFLQPTLISFTGNRISTQQMMNSLLEVHKNIEKNLPKRSKLQTDILNKLISIYQFPRNSQPLLKLKTSLKNDIFLLHRQEEKLTLETKTDSTSSRIAAIEETILKAVTYERFNSPNDISVESLLSSDVIMRGLNKLISLQQDRFIYRIYSVGNRTRYFTHLLFKHEAETEHTGAAPKRPRVS